MRRLLLGLVLSVVMLFALMGPAMATEAGPVGGLEPAEANDPDNEFAPGNYEGNFLWGGAVGLLFLVGVGFAGAGGLYYLLVVKANESA